LIKGRAKKKKQGLGPCHEFLSHLPHLFIDKFARAAGALNGRRHPPETWTAWSEITAICGNLGPAAAFLIDLRAVVIRGPGRRSKKF
jgi:hypothetical protein